MYAGTRFVLGYKNVIRAEGDEDIHISMRRFRCPSFVSRIRSKRTQRKNNKLSSQPFLLLAAYNRMR